MFHEYVVARSVSFFVILWTKLVDPVSAPTFPTNQFIFLSVQLNGRIVPIGLVDESVLFTLLIPLPKANLQPDLKLAV